jgi:AAA15 family ATPase/GTPase
MGKTQARRSSTAKTKPALKSKSSASKKKAATAARKGTNSPFIDTLSIENFKSIKSMNLKPKRVNVFIGEPNSGKTNILEALGLLSPMNITSEEFFNKIIRVDKPKQLFNNQNTNNSISISTNNLNLRIQENIIFRFENVIEFDFILSSNRDKKYKSYHLDTFFRFRDGKYHDSEILKKSLQYDRVIYSNIRLYLYKQLTSFTSDITSDLLNQPYGDNITDIISKNEDLRKLISSFFLNENKKLGIIEDGKKINIVEEKNGLLYFYTFNSLSDTLRRYFFLEAILKSNNDSIILLDEPDTHAFPPYVKQFAEEIAFQKSNQFFITTHNPYMLGSLVEKTPTKELAVFICRKEGNETKAYQLNEKQILQVMDYDVDVFFNLDRIIGL